MRLSVVFIILAVLVLFTQVHSWLSRRRRRRCVGCSWSSWGSFGSCSASCNYGYKYRYRSKGSGGCGAVCSGSNSQSARCYLRCCPVNCNWYWSSWSPCRGCGIATQTSTVVVRVRSSCGGSACPTTTTRRKSCNTGVCCPVNCVVNTWGNWGSCTAACESTGRQTRTRSVRTPSKCRGTACPTLSESRSCRGGCCRRNCVVSSWSPWSSCNAPAGQCGANSGTQTRSRRVTRPASCGGTACPTLSGSQRCKPTPISCTVSSWSSWARCTANNGRCGAGSQTRTRTITRQPYCSTPCPSLTEKRSCTHSCCPVNCVVSSWSAWTACTATCGSGIKVRTRRITTQPSCNGQACPTLRTTTSCTQYNNKDCVLSAWSSYSQCSNRCGQGVITKTRRVISQPVCQGRKCGPLSASKICTSYSDNRNCVVGSWGSWGACNAKCAVGSRQRTRPVVTPQRCRGTPCPSLTQTSLCGSANGGCQHVCSNGACSCRPGYNLTSDKRTCTAKNCGIALPRFCAQGTKVGSTCQYARVTCPGGNTTYPVTCSLGCPTHYTIKGASTITCQTNGQWSSYGSSYCRRNNDPPTQVLLSGTSSVSENMPRGTTVGTFSSLDPVNSKDRHTYTMIRGGSGLFEIRGAILLTSKMFNFEASQNTFDITVRSTDNGIPSMYLDKTFTIRITDVNEDPTDIQLSSSSVNENSDIETTVGMLSTADPDKRQSFTYQLLSNAGGRFKVVNNLIKVAQSNRLCLQVGGSQCSLNYEQQSYQQIRIRSTDSGSPSKNITKTINITINDVNDKPRDIRLSNQKVKENAPINTVIGQLTARDEDSGQRLVFTLDNNDNGRFKIDSTGRLLKAKVTDYETSKVHLVTVRATDNGSPRLWISKQFSIVVLNVNEAPVSLTLDNPAVKENSPRGTQIGTLTAVDKDAVQNLTFSLDDSAGGKFSLGSNTSCNHPSQGSTQCSAVLLVSGDLDFEDAQWEIITVRATDDKGLFHSQTLNITVLDVNDKPSNITIEGSLVATVNENSRDLEIGELQTVDQDIGQTYRYTLLSNSGGNFEIRGSKLFVSKLGNLDYEKVTAYQVRLRSTDSGNPPYSTEATITININDLNERPTDITLSKNTVLENTPLGTVIGNLSIKDPDNLGPKGVRQTHTCQLKDSANGMIGIAVNQNVNQLTVGPAGVNYEANSTVVISVQCSDPPGLSFEKLFTIKVQDINEAPTDIIISSLRVKENQSPPTTVGRITVVDPDNEKTIRQTFNFSILSSSSVPFAVRNGNLVTTKKLDFEANAQWSFRIRVQDNGIPAKTRMESFTVQVMDTNDQPTSISLSNSAVDENSAQGTLVGFLSTIDQDVGQNYTYQLFNSSNGRFMVDNNAIKVAQSNKQCLSQGGSHCFLNYEAAKQQQIRVRSTDNGVPALFYDTDLVINIGDVNDQPRDLKLSNNRVKENATINTMIGRFNASDEDAKQSLSYSLADDEGGRFRVDSSGSLYKAKTTDYETHKRHTIQAVVTDNGRPAMKMEKVFIIEVLDVNEAPVKIQITSASAQISFPTNNARVNENSPQGTVTGTLEALDHDYNQQLSFRLDDDANGTFILDSSSPRCSAITNLPGFKTKCTTLLKLQGKLNYEEKRDYVITVRATDNHGLFTSQQLSITVVDQNDAPTNITLGGGGSANVYENSNGALVGVLATTDEDASQTFTYMLVDDAGGRLVVRGDKLFVSNSANLDYEKQSSYSVSIQTTDSGSPSLKYTKDFSITVLDLNEAPTVIGLTNSHVTENSKPGTVIGSLNITDPDNLGPQGVRQSHTCSVVGQQIGKFVIQSNVLKVDQATLDYEQASRHDILVNCVDDGIPSLNLQQNVSVFVDDVNEAPSKIALTSRSVAENASPSLVGTLSTTDPDNEGSIRQYFAYRIIGDTAGLPFIINGNYLNTTRSLDYETQASWNLTIQSTDSGSPPKSVTNMFTISVVDVNEQPVNITLSGLAVNENSGMNTMIGTLSCQDPDVNQKHTYALTDTASGRFKLVQNKLMVALSNDNCLNYGGAFCKINFEAQRQHVIRVRTTDNGVPPLSNEKIFTINVRDVNDRPHDLKLSGYIVKENATIGTKIGHLSAKDEDKFQALSFSLVDDDNGRFTIDSAGFLVKAKNTDYETSKVHMVTVQVQDNGTKPLSLNKTFSISVENINEAPVNTSITSQGGQQAFPDDMPRVNENSPKGDVVGTIISLDHDEVQQLSFKLLDDAAGKFSLGSTVTCKNQSNIPGIKSMCSVKLTVNGSLNYEQSKTEDIVLRVTDPKGLFHTTKFTVKILNVNDKPSNITISGDTVGYVDENANNAFVGDLAAVDEDANQLHTFRLINNGGWKFVLKGTKIYTSWYANIDYEKKSSFVIIVRAIDNGRPRLFLDKAFTIQIRDINEKPTSISLDNQNVNENSPQGSLVGKISVEDPDNKGPRGPWQGHICSIFNNVPFIVNHTSNELLVAGNLNYEITQSIDVIVRCYDNGSAPLFLEKTLTINIMDENEAPTSIRLSGSTVAENSGIVVIGTLDTVDPDNLVAVVQTFSYSVVNGSGLPFSVEGNTLKTTKSLDYETKASWEISIQSTDNKGLKVTRKFLIAVSDRNDAPTSIKASGSLSISENSAPGTYIGNVYTADQDVGQTHFYQIESVLAEGYKGKRNDSSLLNTFSVGSTSGSITLSSRLLDFEQYSNYTLIVRAVDNGSPPLSVTGYINIRVKDINEAPTAISLSNNKVFENASPDSIVGNLSVQDPDNVAISRQKFTCRVTNPDQAPFKVVGHLSLAVSRDVLDFEKQNVYSINVNCSERISPPLTISTTFTIKVLDVNEAPYNLTMNQASLPENGNPGDIVGLINVLDPDTPDSGFANISLSIQTQSPSWDAFKIVGRRLVTTRPLDFEKKNSYKITVVAMDSGNPPLRATNTFIVNVIDKNDPASALVLDSSGIFENATTGTVVGKLSAKDQDTNQLHTYVVINPKDLFSVNGNTLVLDLKNTALDYETTPLINVTINVTDSGQPPKSAELLVTVTVLDSNDPPSYINMTSSLPVDAAKRILVPENSPGGTPLANLFVVDQDVSQSHTCVLLDGQKYFVIRSPAKSTAQVLVKDAAGLDYETMYDKKITVTVQCTDSGNPPYSKSLSFIVAVSDVNEPPFNITLSSHPLPEHPPKGYVVGSLSCQEPDFNQSDVFRVVGDSSKIFEVNQVSKLLVVKDPSYLDYEALQPNKTVTVSILATDSGAKPLSASRDFILQVIDVNEPPFFDAINVTVREDIARGRCVAQINAKDPDLNQRVKLSLLSHEDKFDITNKCVNVSSNSMETGGWYLSSRSSLSYDDSLPDHVYDVLIEAKDNGQPAGTFNESAFVYVERVNPCDTHHDCNGNASCVRVNGTTYKCMCNPGYSGDGRISCVDINECESSPCSPHGTCHDGVNTYRCTCEEGFTGDTKCIPIDYCASNPCFNNATCVNSNRTIYDSDYYCICVAGYTGGNCSVEVNECNANPCNGNGDCTDGVNKFSCACFKGYTGTQCQRSTEDCNPNPCDTTNQVCVPRNLKAEQTDPKTDSENSHLCVNTDNVIPLYLKPKEFPLKLVATSHWQYQLQAFVKGYVQYPLKELNNDEADESKVIATDLFVVENSTIFLSPFSEKPKRKRRSSADNIQYTGVYFVVRYNDYPVPQYTFFMSLNKTCITIKKDPTSDFGKKICGAAYETMVRVHPMPRTAAQEKEARAGLHPYMYYVFIGIGALVFLLLLLGVVMLRRDARRKRQLRAFQIHDKLLETDGFKTDVMQRHQLSNDGQGEGTLNPMYGIPDNVQPSFEISENPLYSRPDDTEDSVPEDVGFSNPIYQTFQAIDKKVDGDETERVQEPLYETPRTQDPEEIKTLPSINEPQNEKPGKKSAQNAKNKKKKKKAGKKQKGIPANDDDDIPDIAAVNPMFQSRNTFKAQEDSKDDEGLYAIPRRKISKNKSREEASLLDENTASTSDHPELKQAKEPVYDTPKKIIGAEGMSNPLYESPGNLEDPEEPLPGDIVSAFSGGFSTTTKTMGEEPGQSEC